MPHGYTGRILHVDLTKRTLEIEQPPESFYRTYLGGSAVGAHYLLRETSPGPDPLGPDNVLVLALGVLTGAPVSGQSRMTAVARSPLTGAIGDSQCGGFFPAEMKFAGFDAVVLRGRADEPLYLWIREGTPELRPAAHLWGKITGEVEDILRAELGDDKIEVLQTGPAGERGVRFGALMNLADRAKVIEVARWGAGHFEESDVYGLGLFGTAEVLAGQNKAGGLPTRNWASGAFDNYLALDGKTMSETILKERDTCYACTVKCKRVVEVTDGPYRADPRYGGPEYETLATFGSYCGIDDIKAVATANQLCNQYGMDTISCGATIAWAMDAFEHGLLTEADTGGLALRFGDAAVMVKLTEMIAKREGFGDILA